MNADNTKNTSNHHEAWWIDCDPGSDDALAIALMIGNLQNVVGLSISLGNGTLDMCSRNAAKILGVLQHRVPIYKGSSNPIASDKFEGTDGYFGEDSLGDSKIYKDFEGYTDCIHQDNGHFALIEASKNAVKNGQKFKILALAPCTTLAVALGLDAKLPSRVDEIYIMGGALHGEGFMRLSTEFNFDRDPEAAYRVIRDFKNIFVVPIESGPNAKFTLEETLALRYGKTEFSRFFKEITQKILVDGDENKELLGPLYDGIAAACAIDNAVITKYLDAHVDVDIEGTLTRGNFIMEYPENKDHEKYMGGSNQKKLVRVVMEVSHEKYMEIVNKAFSYFK